MHLITSLKDFGHTAGMAALMATLLGPMQVASRICERKFASNAMPHRIEIFSFAAVPMAILALLLWGATRGRQWCFPSVQPEQRHSYDRVSIFVMPGTYSVNSPPFFFGTCPRVDGYNDSILTDRFCPKAEALNTKGD